MDTETGKARLIRHVTVDDAGTVVNPVLAEGQRHGGIAQGVAQALLEEMVYDADGNPLTGTLADYAIITAAELPSFELLPSETPTTVNPLGAKGIGEAGTIGAAPAVQNAVIDAVSHLGVRHIDMPATPARVWAAISEGEGGAVKVSVTVNGGPVAAEVADRTLLVHFLRDVAGLTATNVGCDTSSCGACTVLLDGQSVKSCTVLAAQADGARGDDRGRAGLTPTRSARLHPVQRAFRAEHGLQCGFCTPGMVMAAVSLLAENPAPTEDEVRAGPGGQPVPVHRLPQHRPGHPGRERGAGCSDPGGVHLSAGLDRGRGARPGRPGRRGREVPGRRPFPAAADEATAGRAGDRWWTSAGWASCATSAKTVLTSPWARSTTTTTWPSPSLLRRELPLLAHAAGQVGDPQVRHRGTIGGSLAHADPAADLPAVILALDATLVARGPAGSREIPAGRVLPAACSRPRWNPASC